MNNDGSNQVILTNTAASDSSPAWSPDANYIAYKTNTTGSTISLSVMRANGSQSIRLTPDSIDVDEYTWSSTSTRIAFTGIEDGIYDIYTVNIDGSDLQKIGVGRRAFGLTYQP
jgi:TolB protein